MNIGVEDADKFLDWLCNQAETLPVLPRAHI